MRMRSTAGLHVRDVLRIPDVGDVEDANAAQPIVAHRTRHTLRAAVETASRAFTRYEQQVPVDRHIALRRRTDEGFYDARRARVGDVPDLEAVVIALEHVVVPEREIRIG